MAFNIFGYQISKDEEDVAKKEERLDSFAPPLEKDGAIELTEFDIDYAANQKYVYDFESHFENEEARVNEYRRVSRMVEADYAITDIVNESVVQDQFDDPVALNLDDTEFSDNIKKKILVEWETIESLFNLNNDIGDIFRRWYVDGKIYYHKMIDSNNTKDGIQELRYLDPRRIKKVREVKKENTDFGTKIANVKEYYVYSLQPTKSEVNGLQDSYRTSFDFASSKLAMEIQADMIAYAHSGIIESDGRGDVVFSHLQKALKPLNQLALIEDAIVIYRISRAPERRIFYIDVGNMNKTRGEQYMRGLINQYKNRFVYDAQRGTVSTNKKNLSMMEDVWLPRREGSRGTEVETLPGGQNLGELDDINYFKNKAFRALNIPISRLDSEATFNIGRSSEITRDEVRFSKFAGTLRNEFNALFFDVLKTQLIFKKIITEKDWDKEFSGIKFIYKSDSFFDELQNQEMLQSRLEILQGIDEYTNKYYSVEWVRKHVLMQDDEEMKEIDKSIEEEKTKYGDPEEDEEGGYGGGGEEDENEPAPIPVVVQEPEAKKEEPKKEEEPKEKTKPVGNKPNEKA